MNEMGRKLGIALTVITFLAGCSPVSPAPTLPAATPAAVTPAGAVAAAYWPTSGWLSTTPEEQGMDSATLAQMVEHIQQRKLDLHSLLIVRNGYLVAEGYGYPYSAKQVHFVASVTKSVMAALIGIAVQQGSIKDVQQPLFSLLPEQGWRTSMHRSRPSP